MKYEKLFISDGATINNAFMEKGIVDNIILNYNPFILNKGIPLFKGNYFENKLKLEKVVKEKEDIVQETEVRSKIVNPLLDLLRYPTENIAEEYPVYGKDGRKDLNTKSADIIIFKDSNANRHRDKKETGLVINNSLVVFELKKPKEKIENAKNILWKDL